MPAAATTVGVRLLGSSQVLPARAGDDLLELLEAHGIPIATSCGGIASCGLCRVRVVAGGELLTPVRAAEREHLDDDEGVRLACQAKVRDGVVGEVVIAVLAVEEPLPV